MTERAAERPFDGAPRFEMQALLGRGANGVVYHVLDRETQREVALKTLSVPDAERLYHLKSEFRSLARIHHPNLVQLYELVATGDGCFFTMELLRGVTFDGYARGLASHDGAGHRVLDEPALAQLQEATLQLVSGICALHEAGKLHRDIKPSNLIVTEDGRAVLVDFGLCTELQKVERARHPLVGTLLYMAPEQAWGKALSPAADWYSLGAVLYEAIAGHPAFQDQRGSNLLFAKDSIPEMPHGISAAAAPLAKLAVRLMHPSPKERPSVDAIVEALTGDTPHVRSHGSHALLRSAPFVGRDEEMEILRAALVDLESGRPAVVDIQGPSGIGKTELVERFFTSLESQGSETSPTGDASPHSGTRPRAVVLRGRCHPQESVSYNGFDGVVDDLSEWLTTLPESAIAEFLPEDSGALLELFPVLGRARHIVRDPDASKAAPYALRQRALLALRQLFARLGERYSVVLVVDDAHWGGADTGFLLSEVFAPPTPRVMLVLSYRTEDAPASALLSVLRERAEFLLDSIHRTTLGPIGKAASATLANHLLAGAAREDEDAATRIATEAQGHPLYLRELALAATTSNEAPKGEGLRALLRGRIDELSVAERRILDLVATAARPLPRRLLLAAAGQGESGRPDVFRLARQRLVRETATGGEAALEPYHSHVREAALGALDRSSLRHCHRALADALLREPEPDADVLVDHLVGAGESPAAARFAEIAAERADRTLAFDRAVQLYRLALQLKEKEPNATRHLLRSRLASALANAGRSEEAAKSYARAAEEARSEAPARALDLERSSAEHYLRSGRLDAGVARLRRVLDATAIPYPTSAVAAIGTVVALRTRLSLRGLGFRPRRAEDLPAEDLARIDACWTAGLGFSWVDRPRTAAFQARYMLLALASGEPSRVARGMSTEASELACLGGSIRTTRARKVIAEALELTEKSGNTVAHAFNLLMAGSIEFYAAKWRDAIALCARATELLRNSGNRSEWELLTSETLTLASLVYVGELRTMRVRQMTELAVARERGNALATSCLASGPANIGWLAADDPDEAERRTDESLAPWKKNAFQTAHYFHLVARVQASLYRGDAAGAFERLQREWPRVIASMSLQVQNFRVTLRHLRARSALALAARTSSRLLRFRLLRLAKKEAQRLRADDVVWSAPLAASIEAGTFALEGKPVAAIDRLATAAAQFRSLDMELHAVAADYERGRRLDGDTGRALLRRAESWMISEHVARPERLAALLFPPVG